MVFCTIDTTELYGGKGLSIQASTLIKTCKAYLLLSREYLNYFKNRQTLIKRSTSCHAMSHEQSVNSL